MPVNFYFDAPVHRAIAVGLRLRGVKVLTAREDDNSSASDEISSQISVGYAVQELEIYAKLGEPEEFLNQVFFL